jgi:hypothetical protein
MRPNKVVETDRVFAVAAQCAPWAICLRVPCGKSGRGRRSTESLGFMNKLADALTSASSPSFYWRRLSRSGLQ